MAITARYDDEANALYVGIAERERSRTIEVDESTYVDVDDLGAVVGIEFLYPSAGVALQEVARRFSLLEQQPAIVAAIAGSGAPAPTLTVTGGQYLAQTATVMQTVEGTVQAASFRAMSFGSVDSSTVGDENVTVTEAEFAAC